MHTLLADGRCATNDKNRLASISTTSAFFPDRNQSSSAALRIFGFLVIQAEHRSGDCKRQGSCLIEG